MNNTFEFVYKQNNIKPTLYSIYIIELAKVDPSISALCDIHVSFFYLFYILIVTKNYVERWLILFFLLFNFNKLQNTLTNTVIRKWASKELKEKYLPRLATDTVGSFCISESGAGSDAFALTTRAEDKGDHYVINGGKMWISNSGEADIFVIFANV